MKRFVLTTLITAACLAQAPGPQPSQSLKGVKPKNLAPVSTEILRVKLPRPAGRKLKNGLPVLVIENHRLPTVNLDLVLPASGLSDPEGLPGVAEGTAEMLKMGAGKRTAKEIAEALSELGASINVQADSGARSTHIYASTLIENLDALLDILSDVLLRPTFPQDELEKWKARQLSRLQQVRTSEFFLGSERLHKVLYEGDARAITSPTPESVKKITREDLIAYYKNFYRPGNSLLGVTGDVTPGAITARLDKLWASWETAMATEPRFQMNEPLPERKIYLIHRPNSVQTFLMLANRAIDRMHPDYIACQVMNRVLGAGPAARLFRNIREDKGYTYGVGSSFTALKYMNHFTASSSVRSEVTGPAIEEFLKEFRDIRDRAVPKEELENAKRAIVASFALGLENQMGVLRQITTQREYGLPADYWDTYPARVMAVTAEDVQRVARKYVPVDNLQLVAVGDAGKIRDVLAKYGPIEEYSAEGTKVAR